MNIYCETCNKEFSGNVSAEQHWVSAAHQKKVEEKKNSATQPSMRHLWCNECNVQSNSQQQFQQHIVSPRHMELVERAMRFSQHTPTPSPDAHFQNHLGNAASPGNPRDQSTNEEKEYVFTGSKGHCFICDLQLTSSQHARQHISGSKHQKKKNQIQSGTDSNTVLSCTICNVPFSSQGNAQQHLESAKHMKRKRELEQQQSRNQQLFNNVQEFRSPVNVENSIDIHNHQNVGGLYNNSVARCGMPPLERSLPMVAPDLSHNMSRLTIGGSSLNPAQNASPRALYTFDGKEGYCNICHVDFTSPQNAQQHLDGAKHQRAEKLWQQDNSNDDQSNRCSICNVVFSGPENAQQHYASDKHKKRAALPATNFSTFESGKTEFAAVNSPKFASLPLNIQPDGASHLRQTDAGSLADNSGNNRVNQHGSGHGFASGTESMSLTSSVYLTADSGAAVTGFSSRQDAEMHVQSTYKNPSLPISSSGAAEQGAEGSVDILPPYRFNGLRGQCNVCSIELTSRQHANQHLGGKNHVKALERWKSQAAVENVLLNREDKQQPYVFTGGRGYCNVCRIELTSSAHANQHLRGGPHEKALARWNVRTNGTPVEERQETEVATPRPTGEEPAYVFQGSRGHCFVCNIELTSRQHATQHLQGTNHAKAEKRRTMETQSQECKICFKSFSGPESATQHYASAKHKSKAAMKSGAMGMQDDMSSDGSRASTPGNPYTCEVCQCPLNSFQQLSIHKKSPKHLETVEKMQRYVAVKVRDMVSREVTPNDGEPTGQFNELWKALRTGEISEVKGVVPNADMADWPGPGTATVASNGNTITSNGNTIASNGNTIAGATAPLPTQPGDSLMSVKSSLGTALHSSPSGNHDSVLRDGSVNAAKKQMPSGYISSGFDPSLVNSGISANGVLLSLNGASASPSGRSNLPSEHDDSESNSGGGCESNTRRRPNTYNVLKNKNSTKRNKVNLDSYDDNGEDSDDEPLPLPRCDDLDMNLPDDSNEASMASYAPDAGDFLEQGPHVSMTQSAFTTDDNISMNSRSTPRNLNSLMSDDVDSMVYAGSNADLLSGFTGVSSGFPNAIPENPFKGVYRYYCQLCKRPMNTKKDYEAHMDSVGHKQKAAEVQAPVRSELGQIERNLSLDKATDEAYTLTDKVPRSYQVELFCKTMEGDRVIFLPTGTGKTLVSIMTMSCMLTLNPRRPVMFLVDKVLLVLQQSKVIQKELGDREYQRLPLNGENPNLTTRRLKIATLCGNILPADSTPLYRHDIVVTTAAYADNLLDKQRLHWKDFSLVVFDEAHHCVKKHPFNRLLSTYHCPCAPEHRPKVLGLTASPAGRESVESTLIMLMGLFENLGGATVAIVQGKTAQEELKKYQSNAKPLINYEPYSNEEMAFRKKLREYLCLCYQKLATLSDLEAECSWNMGEITRNLSEFAERLDGAAIERLLNVLGGLKAKSNSPATQSNLQFLKDHLKIVIISMMDMDSLGIPSAIGDLQLLSNPDSGFNFAKTLGIPCADLEDAVKRNSHSVSVQNEFQDNPNHITLYTQLLETLTNPTYIDWAKGREPMALILVRERAHAHTLSNFLKQSKLVAEHDLKVTKVVGHGSGQADDGMKVKAQKRVLDGVKRKKYNIIVATSVAEEGVDIPECELVVCINPPSTVTGLVQMRGRARKKDSFFVILCKSQDEQDKMKGLLMREQYMMEAAKRCVEKQEQQQRLL